MTRQTGMMGLETFRAVVDQLAPWKPELRLFNFGEPLLHPELTAMIRYARTKGVATHIQTNGLLLDEIHCKALIEAGIDYIGVSVNGITEAEYATIRPGCRLADVKENVRLLRATLRQLGASVYLHVNAQILASERNDRQADINRFANYWEGLPDSLSVSGISLFENVSVMKTGRNATVRQAELPRKQLSAVACSEPFDRLVVKWDGRVTPCCVDYDARLVLGQIGRQTLEEIWHGAALAALRLLVSEKRYESSALCRSCPKLYSTEFTLLFKKIPHAKKNKNI